MEKLKLPDLPYAYKDLEPYMSEEILKLHHQKHHAAYVSAANELIDKLQEARDKNTEADYKSILKSLSFNIGGAVMHNIFWEIMAPESQGKNHAHGEILEAIEKEFGSFERFKAEFSQTAKSVEGSGWAALVSNKQKELSLMQIEKHNTNIIPEAKILLCLDVWEHAYYPQYKNDRAGFIENWWNIINWEEVEKRFVSY